MDRIHHVAHRAERGDDQRHFLFDRNHHVGHQARIGRVDDVVDAIGCGVRLQPRLDLLQPVPIALGRALVQRGEGADHARIAGLDHQIRAGHQEHGRGDDRQLEAGLQGSGNGHGSFPRMVSAGCFKGR
ncbi:hypothetical protein D3C75_1063580 [compost metagenome]